ncbi:MAG: hypothetical protein AAGA48_14220 [Myxococcota bacterium]
MALRRTGTALRCMECGQPLVRRGRRGPLPQRCRGCDGWVRRERMRRRRRRARLEVRRAQKRRYDRETKPLRRVLDWALAHGYLKVRVTIAELRDTHPRFRRSLQRPVVAAYRAARRGGRCRAGFEVLRIILLEAGVAKRALSENARGAVLDGVCSVGPGCDRGNGGWLDVSKVAVARDEQPHQQYV